MVFHSGGISFRPITELEIGKRKNKLIFLYYLNINYYYN